MTEPPEKIVSAFYNDYGWKKIDDISIDAGLWEDLRPNAAQYVSNCRSRVMRHIPKSGKYILDMASGPVQYKEYIEYSKNYQKRYCVDMSCDALDQAKIKLGDHGVYMHGSFFDIKFQKNYFDCSISLHTIYHIDENDQESAVLKLLDVTKVGGTIIIVYSNPDSLPMRMAKLIRNINQFLKSLLFNKFRYTLGTRNSIFSGQEPSLYFYAHPLSWWQRFSNIADVRFYPWRSLSSAHQKLLIPNNWIGIQLLKILFFLEDCFPNFFVANFQYPMIVLRKK